MVQWRKSEPSGSDAIEMVGLTLQFGALVAVDHIDCQVPYGEIFGLLGVNGAGKTSTIKMLTTLLPPSSGRARVAGYDVVASPAEVRQRIGYVPQMLSADGGLTGYENLLLSARLYGVGRTIRRQRIEDAVQFMGLAQSAHRLVRTYSGGMIRRLELAQATLHQPKVLFLDEPTIGLDPVARHSVWERLAQLNREFGITILLTTHDMEEAEQLCRDIAILHAGRVAVRGRPAQLKASVSPTATLDQVFAHYSAVSESGRLRDTAETRRTAQRLG
jgi:ABC-2 type transport system ATP-binding protein